MFTVSNLLSFVHILGLALGLGAATVKTRLLFKCITDYGFVPIFLGVIKPITMIIILGQILLTLSGIGWMLYGYSFTTVIIIKIILLGLLWILGPVIDNVITPRFEKLAPLPGENASPSFVIAQKQLLAAEIGATGLFYILLIMGILL
jgi:hypothetical protein